MVGIALAMFVALFGFGHEFVGWNDPGGAVQLGLFLAFVLGMVSGYKARD